MSSAVGRTPNPCHELEGGSFVLDGALPVPAHGSRCVPLVGADSAAQALSLFGLAIADGDSRAWRAADSETVLYVLEGRGVVAIGERLFGVHPGCGVYVRAGEDFSLAPVPKESLQVLAVVCPQGGGLSEIREAGAHFDGSQPGRVVDAALAERHPTGDRFYKLLVGAPVGSREVTQFIGGIPQSCAPEHYHEYEEVICILSGRGRMWTGEASAAVSPGSVIFLPRRQPHSLECTDPEGMTLVGMFYPAGSPAVRYDSE